MRRVAIGLGVGTMLLWWCAEGQILDRVQQAESLQRRQSIEEVEKPLTQESAPELFADELKDVGPQSIVTVKQRRTHFEAGIDSQYFFTSNMFLEEDDPTDTTVFVNSVYLALAPVPYVVGPGQLQPSVGFRHTWFNYGLEDHHAQLGDFDFDSQTAFAEMRYRLRGGWGLSVGFDWTRLLDHHPDYFDYNQFYTEYVPRWGANRQFVFSETRFLTIGYEGAYRVTDTDNLPDSSANDRTDHVLAASYTHAFSPRLVGQPYYRFQYSRYTHIGDRDDFIQTAGFSIYYAFARWISLRAFGSYERRDSDGRFAPDYEKFDGGLGLALVGRF